MRPRCARSASRPSRTRPRRTSFQALIGGDAWVEGLSQVAERDGELVAYAVLSRCAVGYIDALVLAPCAVREDVQRQGAGTATIEAALASARAAGEPVIVALGNSRYYARFGFVQASTLRISAPVVVPDEALMALALTRTRPAARSPIPPSSELSPLRADP